MDNDLIDFIYTKHPGIKERQTREELTEFLNKYANNIVYVKENNKPSGVAFYLRLNNKTYKRISKCSNILTDTKMSEKLISQNGKNIHFIQALANGGYEILKMLRMVIKKEQPQTVSWYKEDMKKLKVIKIGR